MLSKWQGHEEKEMITYEQLKQNPKTFKGLTGLTVDEFDALYGIFEPAWLS